MKRVAKQPTVFVDSVAGSNSNTGLNSALPKATIAAALPLMLLSTDSLGLKRGGSWREGVYGIPAGSSVVAYGLGDAPILDSSDVATGWAVTAGRTNVWDIAWVKNTSYSNDSGTTPLMLWEDDVQLAAVSSVANCESTTGSFYWDTTRLYYHPSTATPVSHVVAATKRPEGVFAYDLANVTVDGIRARRSYAHYGGISNGVSGATKRCIVDGCGIHHMVLATGAIIEDLVYLESSPTHTGGTVPLAVYQPTGVGSNLIVRRLFMIGALATRTIQGAIYCHTSNDPTTAFDSVLYDQCYTSYGQGFNGNVNNAYGISNSFVENGTTAAVLGVGTPTISRSIFKNCVGTSASQAIIADSGPVDPTNRTRTITNSIIYVSSTASSGGANYGLRLTPRQGSVTLTNCIIYFDTPNQTPQGVWAQSNGASNGLTVTINNCVIVVPKGGAAALKFQDSNVTYVGDHNVFVRLDVAPSSIPFYWNNAYLEGLTNWRVSSSQDAHSVYLSAAQFATFFSGTVANGDFRINASNAVTDANGTIYTGQFPDGALLSTVGVQQYWNWNTRAIVATAPITWPVPPQTIAQANTYVNSPTTWNFYS